MMRHEKQTVLAAFLSLVLAVCLTGCGTALGRAASGPKDGAAVAETGSPMPYAGSADAPEEVQANFADNHPDAPKEASEPSIVDFDGDGLEDAASADTISNGDGKATLTVSLGTGDEIVETFTGYWMPVVSTGDLDGDGRDDIVLHLFHWGGYAGPVRVFRLDNAELAEFPTAIIANDSVAYDQRHLTDITESEPMEAVVMQSDGESLLRLKYAIDITANAEAPSAWFVDCKWTGAAWHVEAANVGEAYGTEFMGFNEPEPLPEPEIPTAHRAGFVKPELTFVDPDKPLAWAGDPDAQNYDVERNMMTISAREQAYIALQLLYDMTGWQPEKCYVFCGGNTYSERVSFSLYEDGYNKTFFSANLDACTGYVKGMRIAWKQRGVEYSPIDPSACDLPDSFSSMAYAEIAQWFYENSTYGDRRAVASAEADGPYVRLTLGNGDFYEIGMQEGVGLPQNFYGPYPKGFTH